MGHVVHHIHIDAPPERVFELAIQIERLPEWQANLVEVRDVAGPGDRIGTSWTAVLKIAGRKLESRWEITRAERPTRLESSGTAPGGGRATMVNRFEPAADGTDSSIEIDYELPGGFVGDVADKLFVERSVERDTRHSAENFKAICEAGVIAAV